MSYTTRKDLFEKIETHRDRPLIAYVTSIRPNFSGQMAGDSVDYIIKQIQSIPTHNVRLTF